METAENVQDNVAVPVPVTLVGDRAQEVLLVVRLTTPAKPLVPTTLIVDVPVAPTLTVTEVGDAVTE